MNLQYLSIRGGGGVIDCRSGLRAGGGGAGVQLSEPKFLGGLYGSDFLRCCCCSG